MSAQTLSSTPAPANGKETPATVRELIDLNTALTALLIEETRLIETMNIGMVGELQDRKLRLTALLERAMRYLARHPEILAYITPAERTELQKAGEAFRIAAKKNYDKLLVAREVNKTVVKCVTDVLSQRARGNTYGKQGVVQQNTRMPISVTLNQTI